MMDQSSIVLYLHLKRLSVHAIHDDLVAILGPKAVAYSTVTRCLRGAKLSIAEVTLDPEPSSPRLNDFNQCISAALEAKKSHFRPCENLTKQPISHELPCIERSLDHSGPYDVFFARCRTVSLEPKG
jgi:hypothetical protein